MGKALFVSHVGGFARFNRPIIAWLKQQGWTVDYAANGPLNIDVCDRVFQVPFARSPFSKANITAYKQLKKIIDADNYDLIHCHTPVGGAVARLAARAARKRGTKVVYTAHGFHFYTGAPLINWLLYYPAEKILARMTDALITINTEDYKRAQRKRFPTKIYYTPGVGVDLTRFKPAMPEEKAELRRKYGYSDDDFILVYAAEYTKNKNHRFIIEAATALKKSIPNVKILFAGEGFEMENCKALVKELHLEDTVHILGYVNGIENIYRLSDVGISASIREGLPVNIIECMACGLPIVATQNRGHADLVRDGENGILYSHKNPVVFRSGLIRINADRSLYLALSQGNPRAAERFRVEDVVEATALIYRKILPGVVLES